MDRAKMKTIVGDGVQFCCTHSFHFATSLQYHSIPVAMACGDHIIYVTDGGCVGSGLRLRGTIFNNAENYFTHHRNEKA